ncbi:hypothetical protein ElyMa_000868000 [Elysia marginata]|uniref:Uncharacterized protein n=1 Tax=Elysia marginata TaxID=1093978 RepID=A0AAV4H577_9GAST|nr:hypothetical protein ElyMa_000868000 [Elysia marginata]
MTETMTFTCPDLTQTQTNIDMTGRGMTETMTFTCPDLTHTQTDIDMTETLTVSVIDQTSTRLLLHQMTVIGLVSPESNFLKYLELVIMSGDLGGRGGSAEEDMEFFLI